MFEDDTFIRVRELQRIDIKPDEVLVVQLGIDGMNDEQIRQYCHDVAVALKTELPEAKMIITTVSKQNPIEFITVKQSEIDEPAS